MQPQVYKSCQKLSRHRFSAYRLRSSRNNCSYQCNIWYADIVRSILHQFFTPGRWTEACFAPSTGCPSIALLLGAAHPLMGNILKQKSDPFRNRHAVHQPHLQTVGYSNCSAPSPTRPLEGHVNACAFKVL